jgi:hypothetical protein
MNCITQHSYEARVFTLSLSEDLAELCGNLMGNDKSLTPEQRSDLSTLMAAAFTVRDSLPRVVLPATDEIPWPGDDEGNAHLAHSAVEG